MHIPIHHDTHKEGETQKKRNWYGIVTISACINFVLKYNDTNNNTDKYKSNTSAHAQRTYTPKRKRTRSKFLKFDTKRTQANNCLLMQNVWRAKKRSLAKMTERARSKRSSLQKQIKKKNSSEEEKRERKKKRSTLSAAKYLNAMLVNLRMK